MKPPAVPALPQFISPASAFPIVVASNKRLLQLSEFAAPEKKSTELVEFCISLVSWNLTPGSQQYGTAEGFGGIPSQAGAGHCACGSGHIAEVAVLLLLHSAADLPLRGYAGYAGVDVAGKVGRWIGLSLC